RISQTTSWWAPSLTVSASLQSRASRSASTPTSCPVAPSTPRTRLYNATYAHEVYGGMDWGAHLLPSWLTFSSFSVPLARDRGLNYTGLRCPALRLAGNVDDISTVLDWTLDPDYYLYTNCECSLGLKLMNLSEPGKPPFIQCWPDDTSLPGPCVLQAGCAASRAATDHEHA
ncbi:guanylate cyclase domain-containing protein, partial [Haematococcus lacustris]